MNNTKKYLKSFDRLTEGQKMIVKNTLNYQACLLADAINCLPTIKDVINNFKKIFRRDKK